MLDKIIAQKKVELESLNLPDNRNVEKTSFYQALASERISLIAEVKKASPSKGLIREDFHPVEIAKAYERAGASAVSVLTDQFFFQGHRDYLSQIKETVKIPVLRKDFIINERQVEESKRIGADAILLIGEAMPPEKLYQLYQLAYEMNMDVLVEVHSEDSLRKIVKIFTPKIIGVNNRNLKTFVTSINQTACLADKIPNESLFVSESGIFTNEDVRQVEGYGANAILVGEALMRQKDIEKAVRNLLGDTNEG